MALDPPPIPKYAWDVAVGATIQACFGFDDVDRLLNEQVEALELLPSVLPLTAGQ